MQNAKIFLAARPHARVTAASGHAAALKEKTYALETFVPLICSAAS
jgi:hypothetical protein